MKRLKLLRTYIRIRSIPHHRWVIREQHNMTKFVMLCCFHSLFSKLLAITQTHAVGISSPPILNTVQSILNDDYQSECEGVVIHWISSASFSQRLQVQYQYRPCILYWLIQLQLYCIIVRCTVVCTVYITDPVSVLNTEGVRWSILYSTAVRAVANKHSLRTGDSSYHITCDERSWGSVKIKASVRGHESTQLITTGADLRPLQFSDISWKVANGKALPMKQYVMMLEILSTVLVLE